MKKTAVFISLDGLKNSGSHKHQPTKKGDIHVYYIMDAP